MLIIEQTSTFVGAQASDISTHSKQAPDSAASTAGRYASGRATSEACLALEDEQCPEACDIPEDNID